MAISFQQGASNGAANAGPVTVTLDATPAVDDLIWCSTSMEIRPTMRCRNHGLHGCRDIGAVRERHVERLQLKAWYKYAAGTETERCLSDTGGGTNDGVSAVVMSLPSVASVAQGEPFSTAIQKATGTGSAHADPPQIATAAGDVVVIMGGAAHATAGVAFTAPANYTTNASRGRRSRYHLPAGAWHVESGHAHEGPRCLL